MATLQCSCLEQRHNLLWWMHCGQWPLYSWHDLRARGTRGLRGRLPGGGWGPRREGRLRSRVRLSPSFIPPSALIPTGAPSQANARKTKENYPAGAFPLRSEEVSVSRLTGKRGTGPAVQVWGQQGILINKEGTVAPEEGRGGRITEIWPQGQRRPRKHPSPGNEMVVIYKHKLFYIPGSWLLSQLSSCSSLNWWVSHCYK